MTSDFLEVNHRIRIPLSEFEFSWARSSGPGGQAVNKVNSKAVLHWNLLASPTLPADVRERFLERYSVTQDGYVVIASQEHRDRLRNQSTCLEKLRILLLTVAQAPKKRIATRPTRGSRERRVTAKRTRSGHKASRRRVKDWD